MFRMNKEDKELLEGGSPNKRDLAAAKRQVIYRYLLEHPDVSTSVELASAVGYDMNVVASPEYNRGVSFINNLLRAGYIQKENHHGMTCFYIGTKEAITLETTDDNSTAVEEAKRILDNELEKYEEENMGPEGQSKEDWATDDPIDGFEGSEDFKLLSGSIEIHSSGCDGVSFTIEFNKKTRSEIVNIINNINTEFLV